MNWWKDLKAKIRFQELLNKHTTFKIGGRAKLFIEPKDMDNLKLLLNLVKGSKLPISVIGAGSNILISDKGIKGVVLRLNSPYFKRITFKNEHVEAGSAVMLNQLVQSTKKEGLSGIEFLAGIPGTVGGAIAMNAGIAEKIKNQKAKTKNIGDLVENITVMDYNGNIKTLNKNQIKFGYRTSNLSKYIILDTSLKLIKKDKEQIKHRINRYLDYRKNTQDLSFLSAGCIFKNPVDDSAGRLIDLCGLKGKRIGDAYISKRHANFILNLGKATSGDVLKLMDLIKKEVKKKFNIILEPEIKIWK